MRVIPAVARHRVLVPLSALTGAMIVLLADIGMRLTLGPEAALAVPTGVATILLGAVVLVLLARRAGDAGPLRQPPVARAAGGGHFRARRLAVVAVLLILLGASALLGLMAGFTWLLTGDGSVLLGLADTLGRSVIAPAQVPAGLVVAIIGAPYFLYLLHRSRG